MQSGLPPLYTSQALACTHTQLPFLVSSRKTVSSLFPVFITGAGREERHRGHGYSIEGGQVARARCYQAEHHLAAMLRGQESRTQPAHNAT